MPARLGAARLVVPGYDERTVGPEAPAFLNVIEKRRSLFLVPRFPAWWQATNGGQTRGKYTELRSYTYRYTHGILAFVRRDRVPRFSFLPPRSTMFTAHQSRPPHGNRGVRARGPFSRWFAVVQVRSVVCLCNKIFVHMIKLSV